MREKGAIGTIILVLGILVVAAVGVAYFMFFKPRMMLQKGRTLDTELETNSLIPRKKIVESGYNSQITITPSDSDVISGTVTITASKLPDETKHVGFAIFENPDTISNSGGPNLGFDSNGADGWNMVFDTTKYKNGQYHIAIFGFKSDAAENPIATSNVVVQIAN